MSLGTRIRGSLAALLSASLVVSGALLTAPAASAVEELVPVGTSSAIDSSVTEESVQDPGAIDTTTTAPSSQESAGVGAVEAPTDSGEAGASAPESEQAPAPVADATASQRLMATSLGAETLPQSLEPVLTNGGGLDWGFYANWRGYLGRQAGATTTAFGGATVNSDGTYHFPQSTATEFNEVKRTGVLAYTGGIQWQYDAHYIKIAMQNPRIEISADRSATVTAEMSTTGSSGVTSVSRIVLARIANVGAASATGSLLSWSGIAGIFQDTLAPGSLNNYKGQATDAFTFTTPANAPWISVSKTSGIDQAGESLTVTGGNLDTETAAAHGAPGTKAGIYVQLGWIAPGWQPSQQGQRGVHRDYVKSFWVSNTGASQWTNATGSFTVTFDKVSMQTLTASMPAGAKPAVFTTVGGGAAAEPALEIAQVLRFAGTEPWLEVSKTTGLNPAGELITISGGNLDTNTANSHGVNPTKAGIYVQLGWVTENWRPSTGAESTSRKGIREFTRWVADRATGGTYVQWSDATGSFEFEMSVSEAALSADMPAGARLAVFTTVAGGAAPNADYELVEYLSFEGAQTGGGPVLPDPQQPTSPAVPEAPVAGGLTWGIRSSFVSYINGLNDGGVRSQNVAGGFGNWTFPQAGSAWNAQTATGTVNYSGSLTFYGHGIDMLTFANPVIQVSGASATLSSNGVHVANLNLAAASRTDRAGGAVSWNNVPVTLTAAGASFFGRNYTAGMAMDPLSFTVGAVSAVSYGSTTQLAQAAIGKNRTAAATPPATEGIRLVTPEDELVAGGEIEFEASGFQPNERNILVVMYSEPTVLDRNAGADANGVVRWIGTLPEGVTGQHTITLQGSINVGKVITIVDKETAEQVKAEKAEKTAEAQIAETAQAAGIGGSDGAPAWAMWVGALALLVVAGGLTGLVITQRRRNTDQLS